MVENPACGFQAETAPSLPAACAILGFGYLGRPLAERLYQHGCRVSALKGGSRPTTSTCPSGCTPPI